ncbi:MAG TPA: creatininase family protein [Candidatus Dormibacteraeota bacterium]|nr:creatininase family protein [Candidatus Dormibacteraeota bacterium]
MLLENLTWPEVKRLKLANKVILFPFGSFEQHGPHLPFTTDTDIVTAVARGIEAKRAAKILCLPTLWPGHSTHHLAFPGTLSVSQMPYIEIVIELCRSVANFGAQKVFLLNGHGGNDVPLRAALRELKTEFPEIKFVFASYWSLAAQTLKTVRESEPGGLGHACEMETSVMLHLHPRRVKLHLAKRDGPKHKDAYRKSDMQYSRPVYFVNEFHEVTRTGTIGHPDLASAEKGKRFLDGIINDVIAFVDDFANW